MTPTEFAAWCRGRTDGYAGHPVMEVGSAYRTGWEDAHDDLALQAGRRPGVAEAPGGFHFQGTCEKAPQCPASSPPS